MERLIPLISTTKHSTTTLRQGLVLGVIVYSLFGFLDPIALPENYHIAWLIRYAFVAPVFIFLIIIAKNEFFRKNLLSIMSATTILGELGVIAMIWFAEPGELASNTYYAGILLVFIWAVLIFQLLPLQAILISATGIILYNIVEIADTEALLYADNQINLINNNFFLITGSMFIVYGAFLMENFREQQRINERHLKAEKEELISARKTAELSDELKTQFLSNLSHEIRTPMNSIIGFSGLLSQEMLPENFEKYKEEIQTKSYYLLNIISDIIELSKLQTGNIKLEYANTEIKKIFSELRYSAEAKLTDAEKKDKIALVQKIDEDTKSLTIKTDSIMLMLVLDKLIDNAIKYTSEGFITIRCSAKDSEICFEIQDTGIGIKEYNQSYIFEQFRQVDEGSNPRKGGMGTGLYIASETVKLLGGELKVDSEYGKGSTFYFCLPFGQ